MKNHWTKILKNDYLFSVKNYYLQTQKSNAGITCCPSIRRCQKYVLPWNYEIIFIFHWKSTNLFDLLEEGVLPRFDGFVQSCLLLFELASFSVVLLGIHVLRENLCNIIVGDGLGWKIARQDLMIHYYLIDKNRHKTAFDFIFSLTLYNFLGWTHLLTLMHMFNRHSR